MRASQDLDETNIVSKIEVNNNYQIPQTMQGTRQNSQGMLDTSQKSASHIRSHEIKIASKKLKRMQGKCQNQSISYNIQMEQMNKVGPPKSTRNPSQFSGDKSFNFDNSNCQSELNNICLGQGTFGGHAKKQSETFESDSYQV